MIISHNIKHSYSDHIELIRKLLKSKIRGHQITTRIHFNFMIASVMMLTGHKQAAINIMRRFVNMAMKYHMYFIAARMARILSSHYYLHDIDISKGDNYRQLYEECISNAMVEDQIALQYSIIMREANIDNSFENPGIEDACKRIENLKACSPVSESIKKLSECIAAYNKREFGKAIMIIDEALSGCDSDIRNVTQTFFQYGAENAICAKKFEIAMDYINQFKKEFTWKNERYFSIRFLEAKMYSLKSEYTKALQIIDYLQRSKEYEDLTSSVKSRIVILKGFVSLMLGNDISDQLESIRSLIVNQDKKGLFLSFKILELSNGLMYSDIINREETISMYRWAYLKEDTRERRLIKFFCDFSKDKPFGNLGNLNVSGETELVPYESLLDMITSRNASIL